MDASAPPTTMTASAINAAVFIIFLPSACLHGVSWRGELRKANAAAPSPAVGVLAGAWRRAPVVKPRMNIPANTVIMTPFGGGAVCGV